MKTYQLNSSVIVVSILIIVSISVMLEKTYAQNAKNVLKKYNSSVYFNNDHHSKDGNVSNNVSNIETYDSVQNSSSILLKRKINSNKNGTNEKNLNQSGNEGNSKGCFSLKEKIFFIILSKY